MTHWYKQLNSIPPTKDSTAYRRLKRIWNDKTRYHGHKTSNQRYHELFSNKHETNLTVTLWENFVMLDPDIWLKELLKVTNISLQIDKIIHCNWSYEWEKRTEKGIRLCDIVIKFQDNHNKEYLLVIECKNLNKVISDKDCQPEYYLDIDDFIKFGDNKFLIYCIDESVKAKVSKQILDSKYNNGIVTWQELATVQFNSVKKHDFNDALKGFLCGAILNQFLSKSINPSTLPFGYLIEEYAQEFIDAGTEDLQTLADRGAKYWNE